MSTKYVGMWFRSGVDGHVIRVEEHGEPEEFEAGGVKRVTMWVRFSDGTEGRVHVPQASFATTAEMP